MTKYAGYLGFGEQIQTSPGVWKDKITRRHSRGTIISNNRNDGGGIIQGSDFNAPVTLRNQISVVMDAYSKLHYMNLRYVEWNGVKWRVTGVHVVPPRCNITLGTIWVPEFVEEEPPIIPDPEQPDEDGEDYVPY